jgi:hypothetical protein
VDLSSARMGRYGRAAARWARLLASRRAKPGLRVLRARRRPAPGRAARVRRPEAERALAEQPRRLLPPVPRHDLAARDLAPLLARGGVGHESSQPGRGVPGWAGTPPRATDRFGRRSSPRTKCVCDDFSKPTSSGAARFLGVLPNAVDVQHFTPRPPPAAARPFSRRRPDEATAQLALRTLAPSPPPGRRLLVTGRLVIAGRAARRQLRLRGRVTPARRYAQRDAAARLHLLHTKVRTLPDARHRGDGAGARRPQRGR